MYDYRRFIRSIFMNSINIKREGKNVINDCLVRFNYF